MNWKIDWVVAAAGLSLFMSSPGYSTMIATNEVASPTDYAPASLPSAQAQVRRLKAMAQSNSLDPNLPIVLNVHGATVQGTPGSASILGTVQPIMGIGADAPSSVVAPFVPEAASPITGVTMAGVNNNAQEILQINGSLQSAGAVQIDCGVGLLPVPPASTLAMSATQISVGISPSMLDRSCTATVANVGTYTFQLPGLTCKDWSPLCPGAVVGTFDEVGPNRTTIHIDIRNAANPLRVLTSDDVANIKQTLAELPVDHLKNVRFIQYTPQIGPYITDGEPGNGGGIYIGFGPPALEIFPIGYGVGSLLQRSMSTDEQTFWNQHQYSVWNYQESFGVYYFDWVKGTSGFIQSFINTINLTDKAVLTDRVQQLLVMATHFYNPATGLLMLQYGDDEPMIVNANRIQVRDVIFYRSGNNLVGYSHVGGPEQLYPAPIPIPTEFINMFNSPATPAPPRRIPQR